MSYVYNIQPHRGGEISENAIHGLQLSVHHQDRDPGIVPLPLQLDPGLPDLPAPGGEVMQQRRLAQLSDNRVTDNNHEQKQFIIIVLVHSFLGEGGIQLYIQTDKVNPIAVKFYMNWVKLVIISGAERHTFN